MNLPNGITIARILAAPIVSALILSARFELRILAFVIFIVAAVSDVWDGYLARSRGLITDFGKLADPIADKLLIFATFIPIYIVSHRPGAADVLPVVPYWKTLPLWVVIVVLGREVLITAFRMFAKGRGVVIPAGKEGKYKTVFQNVFIGSTILWYALRGEALEHRWVGAFWSFWTVFHGLFVAISLGAAVLLTAYSLLVYLWRYRAVVTSPNAT